MPEAGKLHQVKAFLYSRINTNKDPGGNDIPNVTGLIRGGGKAGAQLTLYGASLELSEQEMKVKALSFTRNRRRAFPQLRHPKSS